jgi:hypothetical protein
MFYFLVITCKEEGKYYFMNAGEVYKSFYWLKRQSTWGKYQLSCTCRDCSTDYICDHVLITCTAFEATVQVPTNWVAVTPELREKTNCLRGMAGQRRATLIASIATDKEKSVSKLSHMDPPIAPEPGLSQSPVKAGPAKLVVPSLIVPSSPSSASSEGFELGGDDCLQTAFALTDHLLEEDIVTWKLFPQEAGLPIGRQGEEGE